MDDSLGYAFKFDQPLVSVYKTNNVVLTAAFYAPKGAVISVTYEGQGKASVKTERVYRNSNDTLNKNLQGLNIDYEKAGCIFAFPLGAQEEGTFVIRPTVVISLPDESSRSFIHSLDPITVRIEKTGEPINVKALKNKWK